MLQSFWCLCQTEERDGGHTKTSAHLRSWKHPAMMTPPETRKWILWRELLPHQSAQLSTVESPSLLDGILNGDGALAAETNRIWCDIISVSASTLRLKLSQHSFKNSLRTFRSALVHTCLPQPVFVCPLGFSSTRSQCWTAQWMLVPSHLQARWTTHSVVNICPSRYVWTRPHTFTKQCFL